MMNGTLGTWLNGPPTWVRVYLWVGFPTLAAVVLAGVLFGWIKAPTLASHDMAMKEAGVATAAVIALHEANNAGRDALRAQRETEVLGLIRQICREVSRSEVARVACGR